MDKNLKEIDDEINLAYEMCIKAGYSHEEIVQCAKPLLEPVVRDRRKRKAVQLIKVLVKLFVVVGSLCLVLYYIGNVDNDFTEKVHLVIRIVSRAVLMKTLPFWDWTPLYNKQCLVSNPYFSGSNVMKADCIECEQLSQVARMKELSPEKFTEKYLMRFRPLIVEDATDSWPLMNETFDVYKVLQWYLEDKNMENICKFNSSIPHNNSREVLDKIQSGDASQFFVQWVNCNKEAVRYLRRYYSRPYFSSEAVEFTGNSWIVLSTKYKSAEPLKEKLEDNDLVLFLVQVRGRTKLKLKPKRPCAKLCPVVSENLNEGDILMVPAKLWTLEYGLTEDEDTFLLGLEAYA